MTISIQIHIPDSEIAEGQHALNKRMAVLGFAFGHAAVPVIGEQTNYDPLAGLATAKSGWGDMPGTMVGEFRGKTAEEAAAPADAKPEPKKTRAKKAETVPAKVDGYSVDLTGKAPNISTQPEARVDPEVEAQDEADEAAEVAASAPASEVVTAEMLRAEMGAYAQKFGMQHALEDGTAIFTDALGQAPEGGWKLSVVAGIGGETLAKAVAAWRKAAAGSARYGEGK